MVKTDTPLAPAFCKACGLRNLGPAGSVSSCKYCHSVLRFPRSGNVLPHPSARAEYERRKVAEQEEPKADDLNIHKSK